MKLIVFLFLISGLFFSIDVYSQMAFCLTLYIVLKIFLNSNNSFVFREWALLLYAFNYLFAPAINYELGNSDNIMKIGANEYFSIVFPGFILFALGMYIIPINVFKPDFTKITKVTLVNERVLLSITVLGVLFKIGSINFPGELTFFLYLLSLLRFVAAFSLFSANPAKYIYLVLIVLGLELYLGFKDAMFHDSIMWLIFFGMFYMYVKKPRLSFKIIGFFFVIVLILVIQAFKNDYRDRVWREGGEAGFQSITSVGVNVVTHSNLVGDDNLLNSLNRGNQGWILASTIDNMNRTNDFQGMNNVSLYFEAALLPRFLSPNKLTSGNIQIFNRFSGHTISVGTSMGLGIFADGYIAYGQIGVCIFGFAFGLLFALIFLLVQNWSKLSPYYCLLMLPILNYAVRPDCEVQTSINHLTKSVVIYGFIVYLTKYRFSVDRINYINVK